MEEKPVPVMTRIWAELHPILTRIAQQERRSMNAIINLLLQEALQSRGEIPPSPPRPR